MKHWFIALVLLVFIPFQIAGQDKLTINDRSGILTEELENLLSDKLARDGLEYTNIVDMRNKCDYYFSSLSKTDEDILLKIEDCEEKILGTKKLGKNFLSGSELEKSIILSFSIFEIIEQPGEISAGVRGQVIEGEGKEVYRQDTVYGENEHRSRYFFAPSAYNLREGELYYNTVYFFLHDIQYGISDNLSIGMGTTLIGIPFYLTPKITFRAGEKSTFAIGDMMILGTWGSDFFGNLLYAIYTRGSYDNNVSLGAGLFTTNESEMTRNNNSLVINLSGITRASQFMYLVTENYGFRVRTSQEAWYDNYNDMTGEYTYFSETFNQDQTIIYGLTGLRFVNKKKNWVSWQFGLTYILNFFEKIPTTYQSEPWYTSATDGGSRFIAVPTLTFTIKFGKKY